MFQNITPITRNIIIINVVVFGIMLMLNNDAVFMKFAAFYPFSPYFRSWQIVTHMFMHGGYMHILFNMFTLYSFGPVLEKTLGDKKYIILYFVSGLGAFFLYNLWNFVEVQQIQSALESFGFNINNYLAGESASLKGNAAAIASQRELLQEFKSILTTPMVGASGAIFGVIAAFATLYPNAEIGIMFIPIPVKVKYILPVIVIVSVFLGVTGSGGGIAHLAHVGGAIVGFGLAKYWKRNQYRIN